MLTRKNVNNDVRKDSPIKVSPDCAKRILKEGGGGV